MSGKRPVILFLDQPLDPPGGGQISLLSILKALDRNRFDSNVFLSRDGAFRNLLTTNGLSVSVMPLLRLYWSIRKLRPDIIHCNSAATKYTLISALSSKLLKIPFIWHVRVDVSAGWKDRVIAAIASKIIVNSEFVKNRRFETNEFVKITRVYNAVDTEIFKPGIETEYLRNEFKIPADSPVIGVFSRFDSWKGHILFMQSAKIVHARNNKVCFLLTGEGKEKDELLRTAKELGISGNAVFTGYRNDVPALMNLCSAIVCPSITPEPFGRIAIEGMACGKPVIATNMGGHTETIISDVDGILTKPDPISLSGDISRILSDTQLSNVLSSNGRKKAVSVFSVNNHVRLIENIYEEILALSGTEY
ncbi:MAG: glycosyltransferase family 4 protein [Elusimicrobiota bacterium]